MKKMVLIAEDEQAIRDLIKINLIRSGYEAIEAADGVEAITKYNEHAKDISIALLDIMMPNLDGLEVCKRIRESNSTVGIIMLTAKTQESDKVQGLLNGADDYITKPFSTVELIARVDAVFRRVSLADKNNRDDHHLLKSGKFTLNIENMIFTKNDIPIEITSTEFQILEFFFKNQGKALSRTEILHKVWPASVNNNEDNDEKIVDVNIRRIRKKIEDDPSFPKHLITIWGLGYKWVP